MYLFFSVEASTCGEPCAKQVPKEEIHQLLVDSGLDKLDMLDRASRGAHAVANVMRV